MIIMLIILQRLPAILIKIKLQNIDIDTGYRQPKQLQDMNAGQETRD